MSEMLDPAMVDRAIARVVAGMKALSKSKREIAAVEAVFTSLRTAIAVEIVKDVASKLGEPSKPKRTADETHEGDMLLALCVAALARREHVGGWEFTREELDIVSEPTTVGVQAVPKGLRLVVETKTPPRRAASRFDPLEN